MAAGAMKDPRERILEYALERNYRGEDEVDLSARIAAAHRRGVTGSIDPEELLGEPELEADLPGNGAVLGARNGSSDAFPSTPTRRLRALPRLVAAAGLLLALGAAWWWGRPDPAPQPLAVATTTARIVRGVERVALADTTILPGDAVVTGAEALELAFDSGAALHVEPWTTLVLERQEGAPLVSLGIGAVEIRTASAPIVLATGFARVRAFASTSLTAARTRAQPEELDTLGAAERLARAFPAIGEEPNFLIVRVASGQAELLHDEGVQLVTPESGPVRVGIGELLLAAEATRFEELFQEVCLIRAELTLKGLWGTYGENVRGMDELSELLATAPPLWVRLRAEVNAVRAMPQRPKGFVGCVLDFLVHDSSPQSGALARALWLEEPQAFTALHVVGFAERGAFEFQREVRAVVLEHDPTDPERAPPVLAAAYLALRGDDVGRLHLEGVLDGAARRPLAAPDYLLAAMALDALGDPGAWAKVESFVRTQVESLLDESEQIAAADVLLAFECVQRLRLEDEVPAIATLAARVRLHVAGRENDVQGEEKIRALLARLIG